MREIKDDLTAALRRLQESDRLAAAVDPPEQRFVRDGIDCDTKGGGGDDDDEAATLASAFYGEDVVPKGKESGAVSRRQVCGCNVISSLLLKTLWNLSLSGARG